MGTGDATWLGCMSVTEPLSPPPPPQLSLQASKRSQSSLLAAWATWRAFTRGRLRKAVAHTLAQQHCSRTLMSRTLYAWLRLSERAVMEQGQEQGIQQYKRLVQVGGRGVGGGWHGHRICVLWSEIDKKFHWGV